MQKANVLCIKKGQWGHIWRGLKQCRGLGGPQKAVGHSRFSHSRWGLGAGGFAMFFAFSRFSSTFQHYTMQTGNVLYIKTGQWGHIWRGLKPCRGLGGPQKAVEHSRFHIGAGGCGRRCFQVFRIFEVFQRVPALHPGESKCSIHQKRSVGAYLERLEAIPRPWEPPEGRNTAALGAPRRLWDIAVFT
jgi:hypothetical protein